MKSGADEIKDMIVRWLAMPQNRIGTRIHPVTVECPSCRRFVGSIRNVKVGHIPHCSDELVRRIKIDEGGNLL